MPVTVDNMFVEEFRSDVDMISQQLTSRLQGCVDYRPSNAEKEHWNRLNPIDLQDKVGKCPDTPDCDLDYYRRLSMTAEYDCGYCFDDGDLEKIKIDPVKGAQTNLVAAKNRKIDDVIIAAATADALEEDGAAVPFNTTDNVIGDGTTPFSFSAISTILRKFQEQEIGYEMEKCAVVSPIQVQQALNLVQLTSNGCDSASRDYLTKLQGSGIVAGWMGFTWIMSNRLLSPAANQIDNLFFLKGAIGLQVNKEYDVHIGRDPSKSFSWRLYARTHIGATRVADEGVYVGRFDNTEPALV